MELSDKQKVDALFEHMYRKRIHNKCIFYGLLFISVAFLLLSNNYIVDWVRWTTSSVLVFVLLLCRTLTYLYFSEKISFNSKYSFFGKVARQRFDNDIYITHSFGFNLFLYNYRILNSDVYGIHNLSVDEYMVKYLIREFDKINGSGKVKEKAKYSNANNLYEKLK